MYIVGLIIVVVFIHHDELIETRYAEEGGGKDANKSFSGKYNDLKYFYIK